MLLSLLYAGWVGQVDIKQPGQGILIGKIGKAYRDEGQNGLPGIQAFSEYACRLSFPWQGRTITVESPLPQDMAALLP